MSAQQKLFIEVAYKLSFVACTILLAITSFFLVGKFSQIDKTYESVIRLEEKVSAIEKKLEQP